MIPLEVIDDLVLARLDAKGTDAFHLNNDRIPAYNSAQHILQSAVGALIEGKKFSGEALRDLNWTAVFQTSLYGTIEIDRILSAAAINYIQHKLWTVLAVYPEFDSAAPKAVTYDPIPMRSVLRQDVRFTKPIKAAKHYTQEEWARARRNIFMPGNDFLTTSRVREYGYLYGSRPVANTGPTTAVPLSVVGLIDGQRHLVAVSYLKVPEQIRTMPLLENDPLYNATSFEWPDSMTQLLVTVAHRMLTFPVGDGTTMNSLSTEEMGMLLKAIA